MQYLQVGTHINGVPTCTRQGVLVVNGACSIHVHLVVAGTFNTKHSVMLAWVRMALLAVLSPMLIPCCLLGSLVPL